MKKLRVLALHSFRTSASILQKQVRMAQLDTAPVADIVEFVYVNAPRPASGLIPQDVVSVFEGPYYEYWNANKDAHGVWHYDGLRETIMFFDDYLRMHGPFDGVMGFSQGGAMASLLIALQEAGLLHRDIPRIRFCLVFAGIRIRDQELGNLLDPTKPLQTPALHVIGDQDYVKRAAYDLKSCFANVQLITHPRGHLIPRLPSASLEQLMDFLEAQQLPESNL